MTTVIPGVTAGRIEGDDTGSILNERGAAEVNERIAELMAAAFGGEWHVVEDTYTGLSRQLDGKWRTSGFGEPTEEQWDYYSDLMVDIWQCVSEDGWSLVAELTAVSDAAAALSIAKTQYEDAICEAAESGLSLRQVATAAGISHEQVRRIVQR